MLPKGYTPRLAPADISRRTGPPSRNPRDGIQEFLKVIWVDEAWHNRAMQRLRSKRSRGLSLTDCLSFETMDAMEISTAFTLDRHFSDRGYEIAAFHD